MTETSSGIVELVRGIVEPLVDDVDAVEVTSTSWRFALPQTTLAR